MRDLLLTERALHLNITKYFRDIKHFVKVRLFIFHLKRYKINYKETILAATIIFFRDTQWIQEILINKITDWKGCSERFKNFEFYYKSLWRAVLDKIVTFTDTICNFCTTPKYFFVPHKAFLINITYIYIPQEPIFVNMYSFSVQH